jgi:hypothetical protein
VIGQLYDPAVLTLGKEPPGIHLIKGGVSPWAGLEAVVKRKIFLPLQGIEPRSSIL